jgi:hypothetical protein
MALIYRGNRNLIQDNVICLFCSRSLPLSIYNPALDFLKALMNETVTLAGGWHSPLEKRALEAREPASDSNIVFCLAKGMENFSLPETLQNDFRENKVLIVSKWKNSRRIDISKVKQRNRMMLETFHRFLFLSIDDRGNLAELCQKCLESGKVVYIFDHHTNARWKQKVIIPISIRNMRNLV